MIVYTYVIYVCVRVWREHALVCAYFYILCKYAFISVCVCACAYAKRANKSKYQRKHIARVFVWVYVSVVKKTHWWTENGFLKNKKQCSGHSLRTYFEQSARSSN